MFDKALNEEAGLVKQNSQSTFERILCSATHQS
jgi:hypothetical protein